jgi:SAM-dependent methyltransferase
MPLTRNYDISVVNLVKPLWHWLRPGWPDDARAIPHRATLRQIMGHDQFSGVCLNAGCGEGLFAGFLESFPAITRIVHMDLGQPQVAAHWADPRHEDQAGSVTEIPFETGTFTAVLCTEVMEHVPDDRRGFGELGRVTAPGGLLLLSVPTPPAPYDPAHVREGYTLAELREHLETCGFEVLRSRTCFYATLRVTMALWRWQFRVLGHNRRSVMPRLVLVLAGHLDRVMPVGRPWDLVVLARRTATRPPTTVAQGQTSQ